MKMCKVACCLSLVLITGCGLEGPIPSGRKHDDAAANKASPQPIADTKTPEKTPEKAPRKPDKTAAGPAGGGPKAGMAREKAAVGMGEKGRGYGHDMITVPVMAMWKAKEKIVLDQMHHAMDLFKAVNDGHAPKTHKEFMEKIIDANHLQLPTLPAGQRYVYDPSTEELMVEKPNDPQVP